MPRSSDAELQTWTMSVEQTSLLSNSNMNHNVRQIIQCDKENLSSAATQFCYCCVTGYGIKLFGYLVRKQSATVGNSISIINFAKLLLALKIQKHDY